MATAWRLVHGRNATHAFSGAGARRYGGRWNPKGTPVVYLAEALSLAALEIMVHAVSYQTLRDYVAFKVEIPENLITVVSTIDKIPANWREDPPPRKLGDIGKKWAQNLISAVLKVPSTIIPTESNYLLNPQHRDFETLVIHPQEPFEFDRRLIKH